MHVSRPHASRPWIAAALLASLVACGGSSGGGGGSTTPTGTTGGGGVSTPPLPANVAYTFGLPAGPITVDLDVTDVPITVTVNALNFQGTFDTVAEDLTITNGPSQAEALSISVPSQFPDFDLVFVTPLIVPGSANDPTAGVVEVRSGTDVTVVTANPTGVDLDYNSGMGTASYTWEQFEDVFGASRAPVWQETASFAFQATEFLFQQLFRTVAMFEGIRLAETTLENAGSGTTLATLCELYPPTSTPGSYELTWFDVGDPANASEVGPGDDFTESHTNCWFDLGDGEGEILDGSIDYRSYGEDTVNFLLAFGQVEFMNFMITDTTEVTTGVYTEDNPVTVNGAVSIRVTQ